MCQFIDAIWKVDQVCSINYSMGVAQCYDETRKLGFRILNHVTFFDCGNKCNKTQWYIRLYKSSHATKCLLVLYLLKHSTIKELLLYLEKDSFPADWKDRIASIALLCFENNHTAAINFSLFVVIASLLRKHHKTWHAPWLLPASQHCSELVVPGVADWAGATSFSCHAKVVAVPHRKVIFKKHGLTSCTVFSRALERSGIISTRLWFWFMRLLMHLPLYAVSINSLPIF